MDNLSRLILVLCVCVCVCVVIPFILDVRLVDVPAEVTQEEGRTGFLHLPSAVIALIFLARRIQPFLSLVYREVEFCVLTNYSFSTCWAFFISFYFLWGKIPDRVTAPRFELTSQRQKVSRLPTEPPGRPYSCYIMTIHTSRLLYITLCCVCFLPIHSGHQVRWTYQPGSHRRKVTQQDFSSTFLSAVRALIFLARRIQPFLSLVDREVEFCVLTI